MENDMGTARRAPLKAVLFELRHGCVEEDSHAKVKFTEISFHCLSPSSQAPCTPSSIWTVVMISPRIQVKHPKASHKPSLTFLPFSFEPLDPAMPEVHP